MRARVRILGWFVLLVAGAILVGLLLQRQGLIGNVERGLDDTMRQELEELETLAMEGIDPATGEPFASVERLFDLAISRNVPLDGEAVVTFVGGRPYHATAGGELLFGDENFVDDVSHTTESMEGSVDTDDGEVLYITRPVRGIAGGDDGVFVAAVYADVEREEVDAAIRTSFVVAVAVLLLASGAAWVVTGRVLRPVREVTDAARAISETDLRRRIPVAGDDEVAELASTFNDMLDRLERAFTTQRAFVADAGHELRTPITVVQGHLDLLPEDPVERRESLTVVQDELDRMNRIVNDLLLLSRAEQPDFLRLSEVDLAALAVEVRGRAEAVDPDRQWSVDAPGHPVLVRADRERLLQAALNLAMNASQHGPADSPVTIGVSDEGAARLWVHDDGDGIPDADRERIFDRFARGSGTNRTESGGAGLGLAIVTAIVEGHGGRVEVSSHAEPGTTFTIVLPTAGPARR